MGSITIAAVAARAIFVGLLAYAFVTGGLRRKADSIDIVLE